MNDTNRKQIPKKGQKTIQKQKSKNNHIVFLKNFTRSEF